MDRAKLDRQDLKIGQRLRQLRKSRNLTQVTVAKRMGITFQQVQKYESGKNQIYLNRLPALAKAFEISEIKLFQYLMSSADPCSDALAVKIRHFSPKIQAALFHIVTALENDFK